MLDVIIARLRKQMSLESDEREGSEVNGNGKLIVKYIQKQNGINDKTETKTNLCKMFQRAQETIQNPR